ncbi:copper resistance D family protein [Streptomyces sp. NBC_00859]|uniref:copper resistance D family protein n=1 Tax=Streptomyces sp. NBC_00859 TaxID=2903682 RepID=UPI0038709395|nr:CopD family protein [Streptomyces sp. NBC_00859]
MTTLLLAADTAGYALPTAWRALTKTGYFIGLTGSIGGLITYAATVRPALRVATDTSDDVAVLRHRSAVCLAWSGVVLLVAGYFQLAARVARASTGTPFADALTPGHIWQFLRAPADKGAWVAQGTLFLVQNVVLLVTAAALMALFTRGARRRLEPIALTALPLALAVTLITALPATATQTADDVLDLVFTQIHIISGTVWLGGLVMLSVLAAARRHLSPDAGLLWTDMWRRFSLVAMICVAGVVISGLWMSWEHVGSISQFWTTGYGLVLLVKIVLVLGLVTAGAFNQFWLMPRMTRARGAGETASLFHLTLRHFPRVVWGEVALGLAVLVVVPFLSGSARGEAGGPQAEPTAGIFAAGVALALALALSLYATAKASDALSRRPAVIADPA